MYMCISDSGLYFCHQEQHYNLLQFELKSGCISLAYVFSKMESALQELPIEEYSVCQNTLDNVSKSFSQAKHIVLFIYLSI